MFHLITFSLYSAFFFPFCVLLQVCRRVGPRSLAKAGPATGTEAGWISSAGEEEKKRAQRRVHPWGTFSPACVMRASKERVLWRNGEKKGARTRARPSFICCVLIVTSRLPRQCFHGCVSLCFFFSRAFSFTFYFFRKCRFRLMALRAGTSPEIFSPPRNEERAEGNSGTTFSCQ